MAATDEDGSPPRPALAAQIGAWLRIGTQSLGGGASTLFLMRAVIVHRRRWVTLADFLQDWTLSRLSLGNHTTALAALLGRRLGGRRGVAAALGALLIPSGFITAAMTAGYALVRDEPAVQAALSGIGPVTIGLMLGIVLVFARTVVRGASPAGLLDLGIAGAAATGGFLMPSATIAFILAGAAVGFLVLGAVDEHEPPPTDA